MYMKNNLIPEMILSVVYSRLSCYAILLGYRSVKSTTALLSSSSTVVQMMFKNDSTSSSVKYAGGVDIALII
jgi:hypothetical protein